MAKSYKPLLVFANERLRWRWYEMLVIFLLIPLAGFVGRVYLSYWLMPLLLLLALICYTMMARDTSFKRFRLTNSAQIWPWLRRRLPVLVIGLLLFALIYSQFVAVHWFYLPREQPLTWLTMIVAYPLLSVWPQELIFRTFFFHRYKKIIPRKMVRVLFSTVLFAFAHIVYANGVAILLSLLGGALFALTYAKTRSTLTCVVEHSLWGLSLFTLGLGDFISSH